MIIHSSNVHRDIYFLYKVYRLKRNIFIFFLKLVRYELSKKFLCAINFDKVRTLVKLA